MEFILSTARIAILIPAYKPSAKLIDLVKSLRDRHDGEIVVVDDGGGLEFAGIFSALSLVPNVYVVANAVNLGKGAALKNGINHLLVRSTHLAGIVTADADGQHTVTDILAVAHELSKKPTHLVLGARTFGVGTPTRSLIGNNISRVMYRGLLGLKLKDTQTGLRGLPIALCQASLSIRSNRYEFETEMLSVTSSLGLEISEVPIETIYEENNASSHFDPLFDSARIYFVVLRYGFSSLATAIVDFVAFIILLPLLPSLVTTNLVSRGFALGVQFLLLRGFVFRTGGGLGKLTIFILYVALTGIASGVLQSALHDVTGMNPLIAKIVIEAVIFTFNFLFMRDILFRKPRNA